MTDEIEEFFARFSEASANEEWARYGEMFMPSFLNIDPAASVPISRDDLIAFLPHRKGLFERAGATGTELDSLRTQELDDRHVLAETTWNVVFDHERSPVVLHSTFLLRDEDRWRVAVYLNHNNLLELLGLG